MTEDIYNLLLPLKGKWETYKEHHYSEFTNIDYEIVKDAYAKMQYFIYTLTNLLTMLKGLSTH
jgi:hypothetical protein